MSSRTRILTSIHCKKPLSYKMDQYQKIQRIVQIVRDCLEVSESALTDRSKARRLSRLYNDLVTIVDQLPVSETLNEICFDAIGLHNIYMLQPIHEEKKDQIVSSLNHNIDLLTHTESNIFEFRRRAIKKKSVKRSRKAKKSVKRSRRT